MNPMLCWRLTTDTGSIIEMWELDNAEFELLFAEAHRRDEVVHAVTVTAVEVELLIDKLGMALAPVLAAAVVSAEPTEPGEPT